MSDMIEVRVAEAEAAVLDWMVAQIDPFCNGLEWRQVAGGLAWVGYGKINGEMMPCAYLSHGANISERMRMRRDVIEPYSPSTDWAQGGPLIDRYRVGLIVPPNGEWQAGFANCRLGDGIIGPTALIAAMRAIVISVIGDVVRVPAEVAGVRHA